MGLIVGLLAALVGMYWLVRHQPVFKQLNLPELAY